MNTQKFSVIFKNTILALFITLFSTFTYAEYVEGEHYIKISPDNQFTISKQPEVIEFFYYGCPHCRDIHPMVENWLKRKPKSVDFHYLPAYYSPRIVWSVKMYYVAYVLKKEKELQGEIFKRYFGKNLQSRNDIYDLFASVDIDQKTVNDTYDSFTVKNLINKAKELTEKSEIEGVPSFIVKGKYRVSAKTAGSKENIFKVIDYLLKNG